MTNATASPLSPAAFRIEMHELSCFALDSALRQIALRKEMGMYDEYDATMLAAQRRRDLGILAWG